MKLCSESEKRGGRVAQQFVSGPLMKAKFLFAKWSTLRSDEEIKNFVTLTLHPIQQ